jgi:hypothetical protein
MASEFTSVPRPAAVPPPARAREILAISFTSAGARTAEAWLKQSDPRIPRRHVQLDRADSGTLADLGDVVRNAKVGVHLLFAGPQAEIYAARAQALGSGAVDAEVSLLETDAGERRVYCAHCRATTVAGNTVGATVSCSGCACELTIYHHFSRRTASYLGFKANAEEVI